VHHVGFAILTFQGNPHTVRQFITKTDNNIDIKLAEMFRTELSAPNVIGWVFLYVQHTVGSDACDFPYVMLLRKTDALCYFGVFYDINLGTVNGSMEWESD
jgi:hypothetical protein